VNFLRRHPLAVTVAVLGVISFLIFTWAEYGYFCDQAQSHHESCSGFWSLEHLHDWIYNAASNWQSELLFGILLVILLRKVGGDEDEDET
jgi:hypothetical protein